MPISGKIILSTLSALGAPSTPEDIAKYIQKKRRKKPDFKKLVQEVKEALSGGKMFGFLETYNGFYYNLEDTERYLKLIDAERATYAETTSNSVIAENSADSVSICNCFPKKRKSMTDSENTNEFDLSFFKSPAKKPKHVPNCDTDLKYNLSVTAPGAKRNSRYSNAKVKSTPPVVDIDCKVLMNPEMAKAKIDSIIDDIVANYSCQDPKATAACSNVYHATEKLKQISEIPSTSVSNQIDIDIPFKRKDDVIVTNSKHRLDELLEEIMHCFENKSMESSGNSNAFQETSSESLTSNYSSSNELISDTCAENLVTITNVSQNSKLLRNRALKKYSCKKPRRYSSLMKSLRKYSRVKINSNSTTTNIEDVILEREAFELSQQFNTPQPVNVYVATDVEQPATFEFVPESFYKCDAVQDLNIEPIDEIVMNFDCHYATSSAHYSSEHPAYELLKQNNDDSSIAVINQTDINNCSISKNLEAIVLAKQRLNEVIDEIMQSSENEFEELHDSSIVFPTASENRTRKYCSLNGLVPKTSAESRAAKCNGSRNSKLLKTKAFKKFPSKKLRKYSGFNKSKSVASTVQASASFCGNDASDLPQQFDTPHYVNVFDSKDVPQQATFVHAPVSFYECDPQDIILESIDKSAANFNCHCATNHVFYDRKQHGFELLEQMNEHPCTSASNQTGTDSSAKIEDENAIVTAKYRLDKIIDEIVLNFEDHKRMKPSVSSNSFHNTSSYNDMMARYYSSSVSEGELIRETNKAWLKEQYNLQNKASESTSVASKRKTCEIWTRGKKKVMKSISNSSHFSSCSVSQHSESFSFVSQDTDDMVASEL